MSNEIINRPGFGLDADFTDDFADRLVSGIAVSKASTTIGGGVPILRLLRHGVWVYGQGDEPVQQGSEWAINPASMRHGWICWSTDSKLLGEVMGPVTEPKPGMPEPVQGFPWKDQRTFGLKCVYGDDEGLEVLFKTSAMGGVGSVVKFMDKLTPQILAEKARTAVSKERRVVAIVNLGVDSYDNKTYGGQTFFPVFEIVGWANMMGEQDDPGAVEAPEPAPQPAPAATPLHASRPAVAPRRPAAAAPETVQRPGAAPRRQRPTERA